MVKHNITSDDLVFSPREKELIERYYKNIGQRLKKARLDLKYSQHDLAQAFRLGTTAISNYENGLRQIPIYMLASFCSYFGKPMSYFLGPEIEPITILSNEIKKTIDRFTSATYIEDICELVDGELVDIDKPLPLLPLPPEISKNCSFVVREFSESTGTYNYLLFRWYETTGKKSYRGLGKTKYISPAPDDWIIAEIGDTKKWEITQFKNITHSSKRKFKDDKTINIIALLIARVERLVK